MGEAGIRELRVGTYPPEGHEDAGPKLTQIISGGEAMADWVVATMQSILNR